MEYTHNLIGFPSVKKMGEQLEREAAMRKEAFENLQKKEEEIKIIDFHTHIFPEKIAEAALATLSKESETLPFTRGTAADIQRSMKEAGVDISVVLPIVTHASKTAQINISSAKTNETSDTTGLLSFAGIHPEVEKPREQLKLIKELGFKGIKLHPDYQHIPFNHPKTLKLIDAAADLDLIIVTHAGKDIGLYPPTCCTVESILSVIHQLYPPKLVLAHMGGWDEWDEVLDKLVGEDVYFDTAFSIGDINWADPKNPKGGFRQLDDEKFLELVYSIGTDRVLFASDSPWTEQRDYVNRIKAMPFEEEEKEQIFAGNAKKLLGIIPEEDVW